MHSYRSKRPIVWLRICAITLPLLIIACIAQIVFFTYAILHSSTDIMKQGLYGIGACAAIALIYLLSSHQSKCPLCRSGPMTSSRCARHRTAGKVLGSYRLRVMCSVLFTNRFRCPYCGESTRLKVKDKKRDVEGAGL